MLTRMCVPFAVRADEPEAEAETGRSFSGYGSVFGVVDSYGTVVQKGAFSRTLKEWKARHKFPKLLLQHGGGFFGGSVDDLVPVGKWSEMHEDDHGLFMRGDLFDVDTDRQKTVRAALREGELDGLSIGFRTRKSERDEETGIVTLTDIELWEVSLVTFPANPEATVTDVRGVMPTEREFEAWLMREAGLTSAAAKAVIAKGYRHALREARGAGESITELASRAEALARAMGV